MAVTYLEKMKQNQQQQNQQGLRGVSQQTQQQLQNYQQPYQPTQQAQQAQQNLQQVQAQKPQGYTSKYSGALEGILQQIQNPGGFKYSFDGDNLFQYYKDLYTQNAKQGAMDAAGIAAGLTGGYGNTYAQAAANQAYQQNLLPLYDKGVDFMNAAYNRYAADRADRYDQLGALQNAENADYGRYRDAMADYNADLDRAREDARYADETGYQRYADMLNYWQNQAAAENADWQTGQEMEYRYNTLDEEARQADQNEAYRQAQLAEQIRGTNLDEAYRRDTLGEQMRQADLDESYRRDTLAEQQRQADLDETYRRDTLGEQIRQADMDEAYRYATLSEQQRQANMDEAYRRDAMVQDQAQFDATTKLDYDKLAENVRQFDASLSEDQRQYNQKYAASWVADILANGQIPSAELLAMAGLSYEDAQKLVAQVQAAGGGGGGKGGETPSLKDDIAAGKYKIGNGITLDEYNEFRNWHNETGGDQGPQYAPVTSNLDTPVSVTRQVQANPGTLQTTTKNVTTTMTPAQYNAMIRKLVDEDLKKKNG